MPSPGANLAIALLHYPVYNKLREVVTTALTNLDLHDIARSSRTFGLDRFYIVTPSQDQQALARRITGHWQEGWGASYNPDRKEALDIVRVCSTLDEARTRFSGRLCNNRSRPSSPVPPIDREASRAGSSGRCLTTLKPRSCFSWEPAGGLPKQCFDAADHILEPIAGAGTYNHLSVRSAAAILLDRLRGTP